MYTEQALRDIHERAHRSFQKLLDHCGKLSEEALSRELPSFAYPSIRLQLHHMIGAEEYWVGVLEGRIQVDDDPDAYPTVESLETYRARIHRATQAYLAGASTAELNDAREMVTWQGKKRLLVPALVLLRPILHNYQHQGQILAMCRLLENPAPAGLDFPLD